jgi:hypothetical protein
MFDRPVCLPGQVAEALAATLEQLAARKALAWTTR